MQTAGTGIRTLTAPGMVAQFAPALAMVCCSLVHAGEELLGLRGGLEAYAERGSTMGIPLLHPWANRLAGPVAASPLLHTDANGMPIHGVLPAALPFAVEHETASSLDAVFATDDHPDGARGVPLPAPPAGAGVAHRRRARDPNDAPRARPPAGAGRLRLPPVPAPARPSRGRRSRSRCRRRRGSSSTSAGSPPASAIRAAISPGPLGERVFDDAFADVGDGTAFVVRGVGPHDLA